MRADIRIILNISTGKGGSGVSTLTANMAYLASLSIGSARSIGLIDAAYRGNHTALKLLGAANPEAYGYWDYVLLPEDVEPAVLTIGKILAVPPGSLDPINAEWSKETMVQRFQGNAEKAAAHVLERTAALALKLQARGAEAVFVDAPGATVGPYMWAFLKLAKVVNVVAKAGAAHLEEALQFLTYVSMVAQRRIEEGERVRVHLVVNGERLGGTAPQLRGAGLVHKQYVLPYSPSVSIITDEKREPAAAYCKSEFAQVDRDFKTWCREVEKLTSESVLAARSV